MALQEKIDKISKEIAEQLPLGQVSIKTVTKLAIERYIEVAGIADWK